MPKCKYQPGDQVNNWTVIDYDSPTRTYRVMCKCGRICRHQTTRLGKTDSCEHCRRSYQTTESLIGERFGCRVVIAEIGKAYNRQRVFLVDCDCGLEHKCRLSNLLTRPKQCRLNPDA